MNDRQKEIELLRPKCHGAFNAAKEIKDTAKAEGRKLTEVEEKQFDELIQKHSELVKDIEREEKLLAAERAASKTTRQVQPGIVEDRIGVNSDIETSAYHLGKLKAFRGDNAVRDAYSAGRWLMATLFKDGPSRAWCWERFEQRVMNEAINTKGGFTVPDVLETAIINLRDEYGILRQYADIYPMPSDHIVIPRRASGVTAYAVGETTAITDSDMGWDAVELTARKWGALTRMSSDLSEDTVVNMAERIADEMAYAFATKEDQCGIDGDGTSTYHGIWGIRTKMIDGTHTAGLTDAAGGNPTFALLDLADLTNMMIPLPGYALANAKFYCSNRAWTGSFLRLMAAAAGNNNQTLAQGVTKEFMGYPIVVMNAMPGGTGSYNDVVMILFGDMKKAVTLGDRRGFTLVNDASRYLEYDQIALRATTRFDIVCHDVGDTSTAGPLVGLLGTT